MSLMALIYLPLRIDPMCIAALINSVTGIRLSNRLWYGCSDSALGDYNDVETKPPVFQVSFIEVEETKHLEDCGQL